MTAENSQKRSTLSGVEGFAHVLVLLLLLAGLGAGIVLVKNPTFFAPRASMLNSLSGPISGPITSTPAPSLTLSCSGKYTSGKSITWTANVTPSTGNISYNWNVGGVTGQSGFGATTTVSYADCGGKTASVKVTANNLSQTANCPSVTIPSSACSAPTPTPVSSSQSKRVFVTSGTYTGFLEGLKGADARCQERADAARLGGTWKAWLSDSRTDAASRLTHSNGVYRLINGAVIAANWDELTRGFLRTPINVTELGQGGVSRAVWTNTNPRGQRQGADLSYETCGDWGLNGKNTGSQGVAGTSSTPSSAWTLIPGAQSCTTQASLYCFEQ